MTKLLITVIAAAVLMLALSSSGVLPIMEEAQACNPKIEAC